MNPALRIGVGGPVGSGKTTLVEQLCRRLSRGLSLAVVTNDIYTREDAEILDRSQALPVDRITGVETGSCPHTAILEDASLNLEAIAVLEERFPDLQLIFVESGGDNLTAAFSPDLADVSIYVLDVAGGDKTPRKGGPGTTLSDLLVINKIDLAPAVGASLQVMAEDSRRVRADRPVVFTNLRTGEGLDQVVEWVARRVAEQG